MPTKMTQKQKTTSKKLGSDPAGLTPKVAKNRDQPGFFTT